MLFFKTTSRRIKLCAILGWRYFRKSGKLENSNAASSHSQGDYLELFARGVRQNWVMWGNQANEDYAPDWATYKNSSSEAQTEDYLF